MSDAAHPPQLSVIIISYNTREMTLECLATLQAQSPPDLAVETLVVDNGSADGSVAAIRERFPAVTLIENPANTGFGAANNLAMARARGEFFLLLNSDAFPRAGAINAMLGALRAHPQAGVVGPRLVYADGRQQQSAYPYPSPGMAWRENLWLSRVAPGVDYSRWAPGADTAVPWIIGACMMLRRTVFEQVGGFDERFFMYQEEADWQKRIADAGWKIMVTPAAEVMHVAGASGKDEPTRINRTFFESLDRYILKHHGRFGLVGLRAAMVVGCALRAMLWTVISFLPGRRVHALARARMHRWLVGRQLTAPFPSSSLGHA